MTCNSICRMFFTKHPLEWTIRLSHGLAHCLDLVSGKTCNQIWNLFLRFCPTSLSFTTFKNVIDFLDSSLSSNNHGIKCNRSGSFYSLFSSMPIIWTIWMKISANVWDLTKPWFNMGNVCAVLSRRRSSTSNTFVHVHLTQRHCIYRYNNLNVASLLI